MDVDSGKPATSSGKCSVAIDNDALDRFAVEITDSILANKSLQVSEWDADGWHYTGKTYRAESSDNIDNLMRMERVALYVLTMDAINFCFWPTSKEDVKNCLEYEHLAIALRKIAEQDDDCKHQRICGENSIIRSAETFPLSPENLSVLSPHQLQNMLMQHIPEFDDEYFEVPDIDVRCRLLNELGDGLLIRHSGSALHMIAKANKSADALVGIIMDTFPGFRDFVNDDGSSDPSTWMAAKECSTAIHFYKRAQIAVADIWAALGRSRSSDACASEFLTCCQFTDMDSITTFPDYRVPQILRHVNVMKYSDDLAQKVDSKVELNRGCHHEISIRAATVVAVDDLMIKVKEKLMTIAMDASSEEEKSNLQMLANDVSSVTLDWYLWQQGEKLDRQGLLKPHHRVRTTFY
jgi:hypothetical protein